MTKDYTKIGQQMSEKARKPGAVAPITKPLEAKAATPLSVQPAIQAKPRKEKKQAGDKTAKTPLHKKILYILAALLCIKQPFFIIPIAILYFTFRNAKTHLKKFDIDTKDPATQVWLDKAAKYTPEPLIDRINEGIKRDREEEKQQ